MISMLTNYNDIYEMYIYIYMDICGEIFSSHKEGLYIPESHHFEGWQTSQYLWSCRLLQRRFEFSVGFGVIHISSLTPPKEPDVMLLFSC